MLWRFKKILIYTKHKTLKDVSHKRGSWWRFLFHLSFFVTTSGGLKKVSPSIVNLSFKIYDLFFKSMVYLKFCTVVSFLLLPVMIFVCLCMRACSGVSVCWSEALCWRVVNGLPPNWSVMHNLPSLCWLRQPRGQVKEGTEKPVCEERDWIDAASQCTSSPRVGRLGVMGGIWGWGRCWQIRRGGSGEPTLCFHL